MLESAALPPRSGHRGAGHQDTVKYVLALDQGTTSSRAIVFDQRGAVRTVAQKEFRQIFPKPGWVEHDAEEIWRSQLACARAALKQAWVRPERVSAIGIANQRETALLWDRRTGRPAHHAIVWQDRRTAGECERLKRDGLADAVRAKTGLVIDPYFSATKIAWMLDNVTGLRARAEAGHVAFGTVDTWLAWKLSGGRLHVTDPSNASRTLLYDIHRGDWDEALLSIFRVPRALLPEVRPSSVVYGASAKALLGAEVPIAGIAGDQQAALFGQACHEPGMAKNTYGTGCFLLLNTGAEAIASKNGLLTTSAAQAGPRQFALEGSVFIAGAVVQWLRDGLKLIRKSADVEALAATVRDSGGVVLVPAFAGLGAPHWDPYARGIIVGLTRGSSGGHIARAALESIAFQSAELLDAMRRDSGVELKELRVDGGAAANDALMQFQADLLGVPVVRPKVLETTALGAAYLAGLATGVWASREDIAQHWKPGKRFEPRMTREDAAQRMHEWTRALERARGWQEH
jgi:glycerol kinase